jgi:hypothetical protein
VVLAGIIVVYVVALLCLHPTNFFGLTEDDSIYFSSARELAQGHGYVLGHVPGSPPATKYPILYPWILSWVWHLNPHFPENLPLAVGFNATFGIAYLVLAFAFLRRLGGLGQTAAIALTAFFAVHPLILFFSSDLMSDIPFSVLILGACIAADRSLEAGAGTKSVLLAGILSGLAILVRALGAPVAVAICLVIFFRKSRQKAILFAGCVLPFFCALAWRSIYLTPKALAVPAFACSHSWQMTWLYYTSYTGYWKADTLSNHVFLANLGKSVGRCLFQPAEYFLNPSGVRPAALAIFLSACLSAVAFRGVIRQASAYGWKPIHFAIALYVLPVAIWNYAATDRFFLPFLPLLGAGMWIEVKSLAKKVLASWKKNGDIEAKITSGFFCLVGAALLSVICASWWWNINSLAALSESRAKLLAEKREAYAWLRESSPLDGRVLAYEDALAFLYSGRQSLRPTIFSPAGVYRPDVFKSELSCITSSGKPIGAGYWIVAEDDFQFEWEPANYRVKVKETEIETALNPLFRSGQGRVRIYRLDPDGQPAL